MKIKTWLIVAFFFFFFPRFCFLTRLCQSLQGYSDAGSPGRAVGGPGPHQPAITWQPIWVLRSSPRPAPTSLSQMLAAPHVPCSSSVQVTVTSWPLEMVPWGGAHASGIQAPEAPHSTGPVLPLRETMGLIAESLQKLRVTSSQSFMEREVSILSHGFTEIAGHRGIATTINSRSLPVRTPVRCQKHHRGTISPCN